MLYILAILLLAYNAFYSLPFYSADLMYFQDLDDKRISSRYLAGNSGKGVMIVGDISRDMSELTGIVHELKKCGYSVFIFDLPSQGNSFGTVPYRYKTSNYIAEQFFSALVVYTQTSKLTMDNIHIIGYGEGARAVLQTAAFGYISPASVTLTGCSLNLSEKTDFDIINFTVDTQIEWISLLNSEMLSCPIHIICSTLDDISSPQDNLLLAQRLGEGAKLTSLKLRTHSLLMSDAETSVLTVENIAGMDNIEYIPSKELYFRPIALILSACVILYILYYIMKILRYADKYSYERMEEIPSMPKGHLLKKAALWFIAVFVTVLIPCLLYYLPISLPYRSILMIMGYSSHGIVLCAAYIFGGFGGGRDKFLQKPKLTPDKKGIAAFVALCFIYVILFSLSGTFSIFALLPKWGWITIISLLYSLLFYADKADRRLTAFTAKENIISFCIDFAAFGITPILLFSLGLVNAGFFSLRCAVVLVFTALMGSVLDLLKCRLSVSAALRGLLYSLLTYSGITLFS